MDWKVALSAVERSETIATPLGEAGALAPFLMET